MTYIKFEYYKKSGKYYSEGDIELDIPRDEILDTTVERCKNMLNAGKRPGLIDGMHFNVLLTIYWLWGPVNVLLIRGINIEGEME